MNLPWPSQCSLLTLETDHRPSLHKLLQSLLQTYHSLLGSLLKPPLAEQTHEPEWHRKVEWIRLLAINMVSAINELRPMQVRGTVPVSHFRRFKRYQQTRAEREGVVPVDHCLRFILWLDLGVSLSFSLYLFVSSGDSANILIFPCPGWLFC